MQELCVCVAGRGALKSGGGGVAREGTPLTEQSGNTQT